jgi:hypothetical protein
MNSLITNKTNIMTNTQQAQMTMFVALSTFLHDNESSYETNVDFMAEVVAFIAAYKANKEAAVAAHADNSGFSNDKLTEKIILSDMASNLCGKAWVKLRNIGKQSIAEQLHIEPSDYNHVADSQCAVLAQSAHDVMTLNIAFLGNTITAPMLVDLQKQIDKFLAIQGTSDTVHEVSPALTKQFKDSFAPVMAIITNLKLLARDYKTSNNEFYKSLLASTVIPAINVHHTYVAINALAKSTSKPVIGAIFSLTKGLKSATTDTDGNATIEEVKSGKDTLTGVLSGNVIYTGQITIKSGTTNHYHLIMEGL